MNPLAPFISVPAEGGGRGDQQIQAILNAVRQHLGMEIAFAARYEGGRREFTHLSSDLDLPVGAGDGDPVEESYCWHVLNGRLPEIIPDASANALARSLPITAALPVGCHMDVPLRLSDGTVYGSFCCLSRTPNHSLTERDLATMRAFAGLAVEQIEIRLAAESERRRRADAVDAAIAAEGPAIHLQSIHRLDDGAAVGVEALARFGHDHARPPNLWFEEAFEVGRGVELELLAVRNALRTLPYLPRGLYLTVNVSPETVLSGGLRPLLEEVSGRDIVLELTEHARVDDYAALASALDEVRPFARVAIDDVGAGYSGLRHIVSLRPDILKLDMSLTRDVHLDPARRSLAVALADFARHIGSRIVAEGVERAEERTTLRELGIDYGQGWHFSRPMPVLAARHALLGAVTEEAAAPPLPRKRRRAG